MKKSRAETAETRRRIVQVAALEIHRKGIDATGVAEIMSAAGLTRGGFYRHFDSKQQLVAEACTAGLDVIVERAHSAALEGPIESGLDAIVESYLGFGDHDDRSPGCPLAGLGTELARADYKTREAVTGSLTRLIDLMAFQTGHRNPEIAKSDALFALSAMVGAVMLSRIAVDSDLASTILAETRSHLGRSTGRASRRRAPARPRDSSNALSSEIATEPATA